MVKAYAAQEPGGKLEPFESDPGELGANRCRLLRHMPQRHQHAE